MVKAASLAICLAASAAMLVDAKCKKPAITGKNNDYAVNIYAATDCMSDPKSPKQTYKHAGKLSGKCMTIPHPLRGNIESFEFDTYMYWATLVFYNATGCHSHNALVFNNQNYPGVNRIADAMINPGAYNTASMMGVYSAVAFDVS